VRTEKRRLSVRHSTAVLLATLAFADVALALDSKKAMFVGGTLGGKIPEKTEGFLNTNDEAKLVFVGDKGAGMLEISYKSIESIEYGQKASHRIKTAILLSPIALFKKKRNHYLNIFYKDAEDKDQAVVIEVGKELLRTSKVVLEARSGKKMTFQDSEAEKNFGK
jgi:hypothetical protein